MDDKQGAVTAEEPKWNPEAQTEKQEPTLGELRQKIDVLDADILQLLQKRAECSKAVAKAKNGSINYRPEREQAVLQRLYGINDNANTELLSEHIKAIWTEIFSCSRSLQQPCRVSFLGPMGTFSYFAVQEVFGKLSDAIACDDFSQVFEMVYNQEASYGLIPLENSQQGSVGQCLDLFDTYPVTIIEEHYSLISQCLLSLEDDLLDIREVFSHPQALMQSQDWLRRHIPHAKLTEMSSTAAAAKRAMLERRTAVIGHEKLLECTEAYSGEHAESLGFKVLSKDIARDKNNKTRFVVISAKSNENQDDRILKNPKSSCTFSIRDQAGALLGVLQLFEKYKINLSKLESRPLFQRLKQDSWQYRFFADADTNLYSQKELLDELFDYCHEFRILGLYERMQ